jgi:hypothetical protein
MSNQYSNLYISSPYHSHSLPLSNVVTRGIALREQLSNQANQNSEQLTHLLDNLPADLPEHSSSSLPLDFFISDSIHSLSESQHLFGHLENHSEMNSNSSSLSSYLSDPSDSKNNSDPSKDVFDTTRNYSFIKKFAGDTEDRNRGQYHINQFEASMRTKNISLSNPNICDHFFLTLSGSAVIWFDSLRSKYEPSMTNLHSKAYMVNKLVTDAVSENEKNAAAMEKAQLESLISQNPLMSYPKLKSLFLQKYDSFQSSALSELFSCKLSSFDSVQKYSDAMLNLFGQAKMVDPSDVSEKMQCNYFISNLDIPSFREFVIERDPKSFDEALTFAIMKEKAMKVELGVQWVPYNLRHLIGQISQPGFPGPQNNVYRQNNFLPQINAITSSPSNGNNSQSANRPQLSDVIASNTEKSLEKQLNVHTEKMTKIITDSMSTLSSALSSSITKAITDGFRMNNRRVGFSNGGGNNNNNNYNSNFRPQGILKNTVPSPSNRAGQNNNSGTYRNSRPSNGNSSNMVSQIDNTSMMSGDHESESDFHDDVTDIQSTNSISHTNYDDYRTSDVLQLHHPSSNMDMSNGNQMDGNGNIFVVVPSWPQISIITSDSSQSVHTTLSLSKTPSTHTHPSVLSSSNAPKWEKKRVLPLYFNASLCLKGMISDLTAKIIVDTGSGVSLISVGLLTRMDNAKSFNVPLMHQIQQLNPVDIPQLTGAVSGSALNVMGYIELGLRVKSVKGHDSITLQPISFIVVANLSSDIILGNDELINSKSFGSISVSSKRLIYKGNGKQEIIHLELLDTFYLPKSPPSSIPESKSAKGSNKKKGNTTRIGNSNINAKNVGVLQSQKDIIVPPKSEYFIDPLNNLTVLSRKVLNDRYGANEVDHASFSIRPSNPLECSPVTFQSMLCDSDATFIEGKRNIQIHLINTSNQSVHIPRGFPVACVDIFWSSGNIPVQSIMSQVKKLSQNASLQSKSF